MIKDKMKIVFFEDFQPLYDILYSYHHAGGPLHILTDDGNVEDSNLDFCLDEVDKSNDPYWLKHVMIAIVEMVYQIPDTKSRELFLMGQNIKICGV